MKIKKLALLTAGGLALAAIGAASAQASDPWGVGVRIGGTSLQFGHSHFRGNPHGGIYGSHRGNTYRRPSRGHYDWHDTSHYDWHDTTHYDWHPGGFQRHGNHYHYVPGHYDLHREGHWDFHPEGHWDYHRGGHHGHGRTFRRSFRHGH